MDKQFTFKLKPEEYLNFLRYQLFHSKQGKGMRLWLSTSIPALLICTLIFLRLYNQILWVCLFIMFIFIWLLFGSPYVWKKYLYRRINNNTLQQMNITGFNEITVTFKENKIIYKDKNSYEILYRDIYQMVPAEKMFIFRYNDQGTLLLPFYLFKEEKEIKNFLKEFELCWKKYL